MLPPPSSDAPAQVSPSTELLIEAAGLTKQFGDNVAVRDVDLEVPRGAIVGLVGPSGCGKTTLVRMLAGIIQPTSGDLRVFGVQPCEFTATDQQRFGYMPQLPVLFPNLSIWGNLEFVASLYGLPQRGRKHRLMELLEFVDLQDHRSTLFADCSGGMQRRVTLAATLVHQPDLLFLDEPTAGVDPILRERFWQRFRELRDRGVTMVVPTQYVGEAALCDLVAVMVDGRLAALRPPDQLTEEAYGGVPLLLVFDGYIGRSVLARLEHLEGVREIRRSEQGMLVIADDADATASRVEQELVDAGVAAATVRPLDPGFDEIFVEIVARTRRRETAESESESGAEAADVAVAR